MAYSEEQRRSALETFIRFDHSYADTIAELGYPNRGTLRGWWREYERTGVVPVRKSVSDPTYTDAMKRAAVDYYLGHGRSLARTARALGYPKSRQLLGEWIVRSIMRQEGLAARAPKRRRRYSSYAGEISEAPGNLLRDEDGKHHFGANRPNELWVTDVTEFRIPAGKVYLSPIVDCFDGMPISWSSSTSPDAEMANSSLLEACRQLREGEHPKVHSDRGCHYRWPGWLRICEEHGLVRSMSRKGCSPDNARAEGFFGRLKVEFFYGQDWSGVTMEEFMGRLDAYLSWYRDGRLKSNLGYMSPAQYRRSLGLAA